MSREVTFKIPAPCCGANEAEALDLAIDALTAAGVDLGRLEAAIIARAQEGAPSSCLDELGFDYEFEHVHCRNHDACTAWDELPLHCPGCKDTECEGWEDAS